MNEKNIKRISKYLSLILRHNPQKIGLDLNENGWAQVDELIEKSKNYGRKFSKDDLDEVVATNDKKRFAFNEDQTMIRANQGHSLKNIDLQMEAVVPPAFLYHGTVGKFRQAIERSGLQKMSRQHVHLSQDRVTAMRVGSRRGVPIILSVHTGKMYEDGYVFYQSANGVWLTDQVPVEYIEFKMTKK